MKARVITAVIADTETESQALNLYNAQLLGFYIPAGLEGTSLKFKAALAKDGTFLSVYDEGGNEVDLVVAAGQFIAPSPLVNPTGCFPWLKLVVAAQTGEIEIGVVVKE